MATQGSQDLVARVRKFREVQSLQHDAVPNIGEALERIMKFLTEHETPSLSDCTHTVFDSYVDWWVGAKSSFKLAIAEDNTIDLLNKFIGELYLLGIPLTLAEKRTPQIRFVQDICIWGKENDTIQAEELLADDGGFMQVLGKALGEIYPQSDPSFFLDVVLFDATGFSRTKGVMKTSIRLVWSSIIVDRDRALRIHDYVIHRFSEDQDERIKELTTRLQEYNKDNTWSNVFSQEVYMGHSRTSNSVRMPLNDRVSLAPMKKPENRPFAPVAVTRCNYQEGALTNIERVCDNTGLEPHEWVKIGSIRCDVGTPLTEWTQPVFKGVRTQVPQYRGAGTTYSAARSVTASVAAGGRTSGQVRIRTQGGSDGVQPSRPRSGAGPDPSRAREDRTMIVEREFDGTVQEFREKLEAQLGEEAANFTQKENELVWKQDTGGQNGAQLHFKSTNKRVYITGKAHQVRSLLSVILPFARGVGETARSVTQTQRSRTQGGGGYPSSAQGSMAPSAIYAPSHVSSRAHSQAQSITSQTGLSQRAFEPTHRIVARLFVAEGQGELSLNTGDRITITHDPDAEDGKGSNNIHRWVYGQNDTTSERGWFPFSHATEEIPAAADTAAQEA